MEDNQSPKSMLLSDLRPKMAMRGVVTKIELFGAFVDLGLEVPGLLHISKLKREQVNRVQDVLHEGQEVEVWVDRVDPELPRIELTMIRPLELRWQDIKPGKKASGTIVRIEKFGAFVDIGAARPGLVHVSEMSNTYVSDPSEIVKVGDKIDVMVLEIDRTKRQISLSMKTEEEAETFEEEEEEGEQPPPTAMEAALRRALNQEGQIEKVAKADEFKQKKGKGQGQAELEDILTRTLEQRMRASSEN